MARKIPKNFSHLVNAYNSGKRGSVLEGGSRSRKTWSSLDFIVYLCTRKVTNKVINIIRETYSSFKTTLHNDFNKRLPDFGIVSPFEDVQEVKSFKLFSNRINLIGADKVSSFEGMGCDFAYFNEMINISKHIFDQQEMRCSLFWWGDYNPKYGDHWIYDNVCKRPDVTYLKTTFLDNPFAPEQQVKKILSYEPTEENIRNGTADLNKWEVYGLGLRASPEGLIFPYTNKYIDLPLKKLYQIFAIDWGGNDPTTLVELNISETDHEIYIKQHLYTPQILNSKLIELLREVNPDNKIVVVDSARKDKKYELLMAGMQVHGATKGEGSIIDGIDRMKEYKIFVHEDSKDAQNEFDNYAWAIDKKTNKPLNEPIDEFNHIIDACRYALRFYKRIINP